MDEKKMRTGDVNSLMRHVWIWAILAAVVLAGCDGGDKISKTDIGSVTSPVITKELTQEEIDAEMERIAEETSRAVDAIEIADPGTKAWEPSTDSLGELGKVLDSTFADLVNARCEGRITYKAPIGMMNTQAAVDIKSVETFRIEFALPSADFVNTAIGDGERRALLLNGEWEELPAFSAIKRPRFDSSGLDRFAKNFTQEMFAMYLESEAVWEPLFSALQSGVGGYEATVERGEFSRDDNAISYVRVYARTEEGAPTEIEVTINEKWNLPVTVRVVRELEDGTEFKMMWTGVWAFRGGTFGENRFVIPVPATST